MGELFNIAFSGVLLPISALLMLVLFYWLFVFIGMLDFDFLDFDVDVDTDIDLDVDVEADVDVDTDVDVDADVDGSTSGPGLFTRFLAFINLGTVPFMVVISVFVLCLWTFAMLSNELLSSATSLATGGILFTLVVLGLIGTKVVTTPLKTLFKRLNAEEHIKLEGKVCRILAATDYERLGQAEIAMTGAPLVLNVRTTQEGERLERGEEALVITRSEDGRYYLVEPIK